MPGTINQRRFLPQLLVVGEGTGQGLAIDHRQDELLDQRIHTRSTCTVADRRGPAAVGDITGVIGPPDTIPEPHLVATVVAEHYSLQQGWPPARCALTLRVLHPVILQGRLVGVKLGRRDIARMVLGQEHDPVVTGATTHMGGLAERIDVTLPPPVAVDASIGRVGQHIVNRLVGRCPPDHRPLPMRDLLVGQLNPVPHQGMQDAADRAHLPKPLKDQGDRVAHTLIDGQADRVGERVEFQPNGQAAD